MSDESVHVPFGDDISKTATLLLAAAEEAGYEPGVVFVDHFTDSFVAPAEVVKKAGLDTHDPDADFGKEVKAAEKAAATEAGQSGDLLSVNAHEAEAAGEAGPSNQQAAQAESEEAPAAKKAAAKKTAAKKTAAKS